MKKEKFLPVIPEETIINKIYLIRGQKVMPDFNLAGLYGVETKNLKRAVKRNIERFPTDFMFELTMEEIKNLRCHFGTSSWGGIRYSPMVFTEQGIAMLSSILNSHQAILVNIQIIRVYTRMREMLLTHKDILLKLEQFEKQLGKNTEDIQLIFKALKQFFNPPQEPRKQIGYKRNSEERPADSAHHP
ncbi:MAG: ORF6N domain-containing protein [Bacteroidetes bacterium]|nr:ORF6N domain-containing protein [Bacteroidota bacterium]